mgnify:CR=1 FL=1
MPRKTKKSKSHIYVFCEGESEQAYTDFLKERFEDVAVIKKPKSTGLFEYAKQKFKNDATYKNNAEITDEIWFFYDVEKKDINKIESRQKIINELRRLRKKPNIRVRLLITTACIEYWLMLHYKYFAPAIETESDKINILKSVIAKEPAYEKGDRISTAKIAERYKTANENAKRVLKELLPDGLPSLEDTDERNIWLSKSSKTFSTVFEAIEYLENL